MAGKPAEPPADAHGDHEHADARSEPLAGVRGDERTGPLEVERRCKADGRVLLLYSHSDERG